MFSVVEEVLRVAQPYVLTDVDGTRLGGTDDAEDKSSYAVRLAQALVDGRDEKDLHLLLKRVCGIASVVQFIVALLDVLVRHAVELESANVSKTVASSAAVPASMTTRGGTAVRLLCRLCDLEWERGASRGEGVHKTVRVRVDLVSPLVLCR